MNYFTRLVMAVTVVFCLCGCTTGLPGISGGEWQLARVCVQGVEQAVVPGTTLAVSSGGRISGSGGVNQYSVSFTVPAEGQIAWSDDFVMTKMMGYGALAEQEMKYFLALPGTSRVRYSATTLEFSSADGGTVLGFVRAGARD